MGRLGRPALVTNCTCHHLVADHLSTKGCAGNDGYCMCEGHLRYKTSEENSRAAGFIQQPPPVVLVGCSCSHMIKDHGDDGCEITTNGMACLCSGTVGGVGECCTCNSLEEALSCACVCHLPPKRVEGIIKDVVEIDHDAAVLAAGTLILEEERQKRVRMAQARIQLVGRM